MVINNNAKHALYLLIIIRVPLRSKRKLASDADFVARKNIFVCLLIEYWNECGEN